MGNSTSLRGLGGGLGSGCRERGLERRDVVCVRGVELLSCSQPSRAVWKFEVGGVICYKVVIGYRLISEVFSSPNDSGIL